METDTHNNRQPGKTKATRTSMTERIRRRSSHLRVAAVSIALAALSIMSSPTSADAVDHASEPTVAVWCVIDAGSLGLGPQACEKAASANGTLDWPESVL